LKTDQPDCYGQTPLHLAAMRGNFSTVQYLVEELDCRLDSTDVEGRTPFQLAKIKGHEHVAKYLARRIQKKKINIFSRWETSRMPYFFVLSNIPLAIFIYINCILPSMPESRKFFVWHFLINVFTWVFFFKTKMTHPGNVRADEKFTKEYDDITENIISDSNASTNVNLDRPLCHSCHVQRPLRSKHCRVCKTCIHHFDHQYVSAHIFFYFFQLYNNLYCP
jgi:palmitoyltransferase